jgi:hypothetical protein
MISPDVINGLFTGASVMTQITSPGIYIYVIYKILYALNLSSSFAGFTIDKKPYANEMSRKSLRPHFWGHL